MCDDVISKIIKREWSVFIKQLNVKNCFENKVATCDQNILTKKEIKSKRKWKRNKMEKDEWKKWSKKRAIDKEKKKYWKKLSVLSQLQKLVRSLKDELEAP